MDHRDQVFHTEHARVGRYAMEVAFAYEHQPDMQSAVLGAYAAAWTQALAASIGRDAALRWLGQFLCASSGRPAVAEKPRLVVVNE